MATKTINKIFKSITRRFREPIFFSRIRMRKRTCRSGKREVRLKKRLLRRVIHFRWPTCWSPLHIICTRDNRILFEMRSNQVANKSIDSSFGFVHAMLHNIFYFKHIIFTTAMLTSIITFTISLSTKSCARVRQLLTKIKVKDEKAERTRC